VEKTPEQVPDSWITHRLGTSSHVFDRCALNRDLPEV